jgi:hypothetical protein
VTGSHTIEPAVILKDDLRIAGSGVLNFPGGISGAHTLKVLSSVTAKSIVVDSLLIGQKESIGGGEWKGGDSGGPLDWGLPGNWLPSISVPDEPGARVVFGNQASPNAIVDLGHIPRTVGHITFIAGTSTTLRGDAPLRIDSDGGLSTMDVAGNQTIKTAVVLRNPLQITGNGVLTLSGGISGPYAVQIANDIYTTSITCDALDIGTTAAADVPEPSTFILLLGTALAALVFLANAGGSGHGARHL